MSKKEKSEPEPPGMSERMDIAQEGVIRGDDPKSKGKAKAEHPAPPPTPEEIIRTHNEQVVEQIENEASRKQRDYEQRHPPK